MAKPRQLPFGAIDKFAPRKTRLTQQAFQEGKSAGKRGLTDVSTDPNSWLKFVSPGLRKYAAGGYQVGQAIKPSLGGGTGNPAAPGTADTGSTLPPDPVYEQQIANNQRSYGNTLSDLTYQENAAKQDYGIEDPSNPFSRAAALQRSYDQAQQRSVNSYASRGQLYAGSLLNQQGTDRYNFESSQDQLKRSYADLLHGFAQKRLAADQGLQEGNVNALGESITRQQQTGPTPDYGTPSPAPVIRKDKNGLKFAVTTDAKGNEVHTYVTSGKKVVVKKGK